ncbi:hypothetical protein IFM89_031184 [Coptis chinensis]|uniref:Uncharacterized protein n=1 Tax=Coptis chinensis TaxID=261450 RepID=A0A835IQQ8_9MAGN|nr:hypothetical protein IFM89_031184 [Coptis chinensis]
MVGPRCEKKTMKFEGLGMGNLVDVAYGIHEGLAGDLNGSDESEGGDLEPPYVLEPDLGKRYNEYKQKRKKNYTPSCEAPITTLLAVVDLQNLKKQYNWSGNSVTALLSMLRKWLRRKHVAFKVSCNEGNVKRFGNESQVYKCMRKQAVCYIGRLEVT